MWGGAMISIKPNPNMSREEARKFLLNFLSTPNDFGEKISDDTLQKVVDSVLSMKMKSENENRYNRISSVDFVGKNEGDVPLGSNEEGLAKNDKIYISDKHTWQDTYRFSLVSLLFHESTHNIQHFKLDDLSRTLDVPLKTESKTTANFTGFQRDLINYVRDNTGGNLRAVLHMFESDYYGRASELEAYKKQYKYMTEILADLKPLMMNDPDAMITYNTYKKMQDIYFPIGHETRHERDENLWKEGRNTISKYMSEKMEYLSHLKENLHRDKFKGVYANEINNVVAGLHFNYDKEVVKALLSHINGMPEETFDDMSNKAMIINSLLTSTMISYSPKLMATLGGLFKKLSIHPENGMIREDGQKNIRYSIEKFYEDYCYLGKTQLDMAINESLSSESSSDLSKD